MTTAKLKKMQSYMNNKRQVPDWIVDSYLEKPLQGETKASTEKNDSTQNNYLTSEQRKLIRMILETEKYVKPTDYYF